MGDQDDVVGDWGFIRAMCDNDGEDNADHVQERDLVVLAEGQSFPVVLRSRGEHFEFVSLCSIYGIMKGEAWTESARSNLQDFVLV